MAIYHFSAKIIGRSGGRSVVAAAAYRAAECLHDDKLDAEHDYTRKEGVVHSEILLPENAPQRWLDRGTLWNEVEAGEKRRDAQLARDIEISLPRELGQAEAIRLARDFVQEQFVSRGMVADLNVHWTTASDGALQPHAHVLLTMRRLEPASGLRKKGTANERAADRERDPGRGAGGARDGAGDPGFDEGAAGRRPDRGDPVDAAIDPGQPAAHPDAAGDHRTAARLARVIAAARLRSVAGRQWSVAGEAVAVGRPGLEMGFGPKETAWNDRALLSGWRERWATLANARLAELGHDVAIDHRSNAAQGLALAPQNKIGPAGARRAARGEDAERAAEHQAIARRNGAAILAQPETVLEALTRQHSTFTRRDVARFVNRHTAEREQFDLAMAKVSASPELVRVGTDGRGEARFTTRAMVATEQRMEQAAAAIGAGATHRVLARAQKAALQAAAQGGLALGEEQLATYQHVTSGADLALVVGYAGTGKSALLGVARAAWEAEGFVVRGAALSGIAAEGLEAGSGIASRTLASLEFGWAAGREMLGPQDVLVVDEAGLVGSRQMERVLSAAQAAGAKVVLVGDPEQLQAIEAGAAFRALAERHGAAEVSRVRRQRVAWQRAATRELATGRTEAALERYAAAGMVQAAATREAAKAALVAGWDAVRVASPAARQAMLAYTRADVRALNELARAGLAAAGALGPDQVVQTERGARRFAVGEQVMFLRNERGLGAGPRGRGGSGGVAVKNGTLGQVTAIDAEGERLTVRLQGPEGTGPGRAVTFSVREYAHIDHGYAATIHKAQGMTVDRAHVLASAHMDRHAAYVALTRHRDGVVLHYGREEFADAGQLGRALARARLKDTSLDYEADELAQSYAAWRGLAPESDIVVRPAAASVWQGPEGQQAIAAGRAGFRARYEAHQRQQARERDEAAARVLAGQWDQLIEEYGAVFPQLEANPAALEGPRARLVQFGRTLREQPRAAAVLRQDGAAFGMDARPNLGQVLASAEPERAVAAMAADAEARRWAYLQEQARQEEARRREQEEQTARLRPRPRQGMSPGW